MIEGQTPELSEDELTEGIEFGKKYIKNLLDFRKSIIKEVAPEKKNRNWKISIPNLKMKLRSF